MAGDNTEYETKNNGSVVVSTNSSTLVTSTEAEDNSSSGLDGSQIGIIVGVLVAALLITAVILFIIIRRRSKKNSPTKATGTSEVYGDTTAPLRDESKGMLKNGEPGSEPIELEKKEPVADGENTTESSPLKEPASATDAYMSTS
ncbi:uncharacterized protein [Watersipora subatra]|uniref:uncharacterized protein isoform X2 n=1 Tax=Watersipora subatra TaxID=2589382 RepID=UPI00355B7CEE